MLWFLRGLRRGVVTTRYPAGQLDRWTVVLPSAPAFDPALLSDELAARLAAVCPSGALRHDPGTLLVDLGSCTGCGRCLEAGEGAVASSGHFLLATQHRPDLVKRIAIDGGADKQVSTPEERPA